MQPTAFLDMPDSLGYLGEYGGQPIPPELKAVMDDINDVMKQCARPRPFRTN